jgi:3-hydroxymyristoyl/3-hydroxydecanoyl-(acyl carrier protein) dehydratase
MIKADEVFKNIYPTGNSRPHALDWKVEPSLPYFNGHFPGTPILPAVAIIDASTYILKCALDQPGLRLKAVNVAKFLSPIQPNQDVHIEIQKQGENEWQIEWSERTAGEPKLLATLRVQL